MPIGSFRPLGAEPDRTADPQQEWRQTLPGLAQRGGTAASRFLQQPPSEHFRLAGRTAQAVGRGVVAGADEITRLLQVPVLGGLGRRALESTPPDSAQDAAIMDMINQARIYSDKPLLTPRQLAEGLNTIAQQTTPANLLLAGIAPGARAGLTSTVRAANALLAASAGREAIKDVREGNLGQAALGALAAGIGGRAATARGLPRIPQPFMTPEYRQISAALGPVKPPRMQNLEAVPRPATPLDQAVDIVNFPRVATLAADVGAWGRQGFTFSATHPLRSIAAAVPALLNAPSARAFNVADYRSRQRLPFRLGERVGINFLDRNQPLGSFARDETFASSLAQRLPWVPPSERFNQAFLNAARGSQIEDFARGQVQALRAGEQTAAGAARELRSMARHINLATGRPTLDFGPNLNRILSTVFTSAPFTASTIGLLNPLHYARLTPMARREALAGMLLSGGVALGAPAGLAQATGGSFTLDPRSSDFARLRKGPFTLDFTRGVGGAARLGGRALAGARRQFAAGAPLSDALFTSERLSPTTGQYVQEPAWDELMRFLSYRATPGARLFTPEYRADSLKESPTVRAAFEKAGLPDSPAAKLAAKTLLNTIVPLSVADPIEAALQQPSAAFPVALAAQLGFGSTLYPAPVAAPEAEEMAGLVARENVLRTQLYRDGPIGTKRQESPRYRIQRKKSRIRSLERALEREQDQ